MTGVPSAPLTGAEYIESLRDGREIWLDGEQVSDVTTHPAFRNPVRMVARLYDSLHDSRAARPLTVETDTGSGGRTHSFFRAARNVADVLRDRDAIAEWARMTYGWMGRSPDYKAGLLGTLGANAAFYEPFQDNARQWYRRAQEQVLYWGHALVHPPMDRSRPADADDEVCVHVEKEVDGGLIVSGAKVVATGAAITHYTFVAHHGLPLRRPEFAVVFTVPTNAEGVKLICRPSYTAAAADSSPFDYPLSSRMDENDTILVLDRVHIPWEDVFAYRDVERANTFLVGSGMLPRSTFHGCVRLTVKLEFIAGLLAKALRITGTADFRGVRTRLGEVLAWRNMFSGLGTAMATDPLPWLDGYVLPNPDHGLAYRWFMTVGYPRIREIVQQDVGSGLIYVNSSVRDFHNPLVSPYLEKYLRGSEGSPAQERVKVMKLLWDATGTEFGSRHELYERNFAGNHEAVRLDLVDAMEADGRMGEFDALVDRCLDEYDIDGWTVPDLASD